MRACSSAAIPGPVSLTRSQTSPACEPALTVTLPCGGVYLMALLTRLPTACANRSGSAEMTGRAAGMLLCHSNPFWTGRLAPGTQGRGEPLGQREGLPVQLKAAQYPIMELRQVVQQALQAMDLRFHPAK